MITNRIPNVKHLLVFTLLLVCGSVFGANNVHADTIPWTNPNGVSIKISTTSPSGFEQDPAGQIPTTGGSGTECDMETVIDYPYDSTWGSYGTGMVSHGGGPCGLDNMSISWGFIKASADSRLGAGPHEFALNGFGPNGGGTHPFALVYMDAAGNISVDNSLAGGTAPFDSCSSGDTRICGFTPENNTTVTGPDVPFTLDYYIKSSDLNDISDIVVKLHNIDQNVLLLGVFSPSDITLYNGIATSSGAFHFATTTALADGNYRLEASIRRKVFFSWITVPFDRINQTISKQFIVGAPTFIGNLTQNGFSILNGTLASTTATSSIALVARCNPLGSFDMVMCMSGLFIPDSNQVQTTLTGARDGILTRVPWGYITRFVTILNSTATTSLPSYTVEVALNNAGDTTSLAFDPSDMFTGGAALAASVHSPYDSDITFRSVFEPIIKLMVAVVVVLTIVTDVTGSHNHMGATDIAEPKRRRV